MKIDLTKTKLADLTADDIKQVVGGLGYTYSPDGTMGCSQQGNDCTCNGCDTQGCKPTSNKCQC